MNKKEKIINILTAKLSYSYCNNCKHNDYEQYGERYCMDCYMDCYRKYQNWTLSPDIAEELADKILQEVVDNVE